MVPSLGGWITSNFPCHTGEGGTYRYVRRVAGVRRRYDDPNFWNTSAPFVHAMAPKVATRKTSPSL